MLSWTLWNMLWTCSCVARWPLIRYLDVTDWPMTIVRCTMTLSCASNPTGDRALSELSNVSVTDALFTPALPPL